MSGRSTRRGVEIEARCHEIIKTGQGTGQFRAALKERLGRSADEMGQVGAVIDLA